MKLVIGCNLRPDQIKMVKNSFVYRWTKDNPWRENAWSNISGCPTIPLISDDQWLRDYAFYVTNKGELSRKHKHAEPAFMAKEY